MTREWPKRMRRKMASEYLIDVHCVQISTLTLAKYASVGGGPVYLLDGRFPLYERSVLDAWANQRLGLSDDPAPFSRPPEVDCPTCGALAIPVQRVLGAPTCEARCLNGHSFITPQGPQ